MSRTPIWVIDDLAPSVSRAQANAEESKIEDIVRNIFNRAAKGRMKANMTTRKSNMPIAQLIITGENMLTTPSVKERLIPVYMGKGKLHPDRAVTDELERIANEEGIPARFTAHFIKYVIWFAQQGPGGWPQFMSRLRGLAAENELRVEGIMNEKGAPKGSLKRVSMLTADLALTFELLSNMAIDVGMPREERRVLTDHDLVRHLVEGVFISHVGNEKHTVGWSTLRALSALMRSGRAHLINHAIPSLPPLIENTHEDTLGNMDLGWVKNMGQEGGLRPSGMCIGQVIYTPTFGRVVMFYPDVAFQEAQKAHPELLPHGMKSSSAWSALWDEKLTPEGAKRRTRKGLPINTWMNGGVTGVPVAVDFLLKATGEEADESESVGTDSESVGADSESDDF